MLAVADQPLPRWLRVVAPSFAQCDFREAKRSLMQAGLGDDTTAAVNRFASCEESLYALHVFQDQTARELANLVGSEFGIMPTDDDSSALDEDLFQRYSRAAYHLSEMDPTAHGIVLAIVHIRLECLVLLEALSSLRCSVSGLCLNTLLDKFKRLQLSIRPEELRPVLSYLKAVQDESSLLLHLVSWQTSLARLEQLGSALHCAHAAALLQDLLDRSRLHRHLRLLFFSLSQKTSTLWHQVARIPSAPMPTLQPAPESGGPPEAHASVSLLLQRAVADLRADFVVLFVNNADLGAFPFGFAMERSALVEDSKIPKLMWRFPILARYPEMQPRENAGAPVIASQSTFFQANKGSTEEVRNLWWWSCLQLQVVGLQELFPVLVSLATESENVTRPSVGGNTSLSPDVPSTLRIRNDKSADVVFFTGLVGREPPLFVGGTIPTSLYKKKTDASIVQLLRSLSRQLELPVLQSR